jgi:hypothetical protein
MCLSAVSVGFRVRVADTIKLRVGCAGFLLVVIAPSFYLCSFTYYASRCDG